MSCILREQEYNILTRSPITLSLPQGCAGEHLHHLNAKQRGVLHMSDAQVLGCMPRGSREGARLYFGLYARLETKGLWCLWHKRLDAI